MICSAAKGGWKGKGEERDGTDERGACRVRTSDRSDSGSVTACQRKAKGGECKMNIPPIGTIGHPKVPNRNFFVHLYPGPEIGDLPGRRHDWGVDKFVRKQRSADTTQSVVVIFLPPGAKQGEPGARDWFGFGRADYVIDASGEKQDFGGPNCYYPRTLVTPQNMLPPCFF